MEKNICCIGESSFINSNLEKIVAHSFGRGTDFFFDANSALEALSQKQYPLIFVTDFVPAGDLSLPPQIPIEDGVGIGIHIIENIRKESQNKSTPILVIHQGYFIGYDSREALEKYAKAGANHCINYINFSNSSELTDVIGRYLH